MFEERKQKGNQRSTTVTAPRLPALQSAPPLLLYQPSQAEQATHAINTHTWRPVQGQQRVLQPLQRALSLHAEEVSRVDGERASLQRQIAEHSPISHSDIQQALQRLASGIKPVPIVRQPKTVSDWVTVMRQQAEQAEGRWMGSRESGQFTALQRQISHNLTQSYLRDRQPPVQRQQEYAQHVVALQRHPLSGLVGQAFLRSVPAGERPALQRAVDDLAQQEALQREQDAAALNFHSLQRQLAELDEQAAMPVMQRIQARRGAGNPLPEAIQRHLEQGLNHDLSAVRIHDDAEADKLSKSVNALAFTTGTDIYFRSGKFNPNTQSGLELLAHEVTHTVQQSNGQVGKGIDPDSGLESEARTMGRMLANKQFNPGPLNAKALPKIAPLSTKAAVQRLPAKPQMTWAELQSILKAKLLNRLGQNVTQLKTESSKYQKTGATPQWQNLLKLIQTDRQVQAEQQRLLKGVQQKYPQGLAGLPFPMKLKGQAAAPDPAYWLSYIQIVTKQLGATSAPYIEAMRQLAASEGLRAAAHKSFPAMSALATTATPLKAEQSPQLLGEMKTQFAKTTDAIGKLRGEIQAGKIPWKYTDLVVQDILKEYSVKPDAPAVQAYQQALKSEKTSELVTMLLTAGVSIAAVLASGPASLALGVVAAASGAGQAYLETQDVRKQLDVAEAGRFGQNLTNVKVDAAQFQVAMGYLNTALSIIDVAAIAKVVAVASGSVLVGQGMVRLERMLTEQGMMTPRTPALATAGNVSAGGTSTTRTTDAVVDAAIAPRRRIGGMTPTDPQAEEALQLLGGKLPSNWVDVKGLIGQPFEPSKLPGPYTLSGKGQAMRINTPAGRKDLAPLMVDAEGNLQLRTQQRLSVASLMRKNYTVAFGAIPDGHWLHHLIPDNVIRQHPLGKILQKYGYDLDHAQNLLAMADKETFAKLLKDNPDLIGHWSSHPNYDSYVRLRMDDIFKTLKANAKNMDALSPSEVTQLKAAISDLEDHLRDLIKSGKAPKDPNSGRLTQAKPIGASA